MNIQKLMPLPAKVESSTIKAQLSSQEAILINCKGDIKQIDNYKFRIIINIILTAQTKERALYVPTIHEYDVILGEIDIKLKTEEDYWAIADIVQVSIAQARVLLMQEMQKRSMPIKLIPFEPIGSIYKKVKEGHFSLWN